jgi:POT family proton-dependent oligopeptide transporter|tara:strand:- start:1719 stop:3374 length:1656 start_codon:yes stop_codon:yes gene_type:complete
MTTDGDRRARADDASLENVAREDDENEDDSRPLLSASTATATASARGASGGDGDDGDDDARLSVRASLARALRAHPVGLLVLGGTEMWERFGYYAARALLALYIAKTLEDPNFDVDRVFGMRAVGRWASGYDFASVTNASDATAMRARLDAAEATSAKAYGTFACLAYLTPVFGGIVSDALLGAHRSAVLGAVIMAVGYGAMASEWAFLIGLVLVCVGNGAFKPSISTQLSALYDKNDPKRDSGFSIFYCCINLGAFFSPIIAGTVRVYFGYGAAFASAAVGMWCALAIYTLNRKYVLDATVVTSSTTMGGDENEEHARGSTVVCGSAADKLREMARAMRENPNVMLAVSIICVAGVGFSVVYEQQGSSLMLFSEEHIELYGLPTEFVAALNPLLVLALTPAVTALWDWQAKHDAEPHQMTKIAIGCGLLSISFAVLMFGALPIDSHASPARVSVVWIVLNQIFLTSGELFTFPVALSYISKIAPERLLSAIIGLWFGSSFFGNYFSGLVGSTYPEFATPSAFFAALAALAGAIALVLGFARGPLGRRCPM